MSGNNDSTVVRTDRGLTIAGTRITLYQIMDFLKADCSVEEILTCFRLTIRQMTNVLNYIETHRSEVESESQQVLALAEENRRYWEERNRERFERIAKSLERSELRRKIALLETQPCLMR